MITRQAVVVEARSQIGVRWQHGQALRNVACDCVGLLTIVAIALRIEGSDEWVSDPAAKGYGRAPDAAMLRAACVRYLNPIPIALAGLGDVLVLKWEQEEQHFAIVSQVEPMRIIHAYAAARRVAEMNIAGDWRSGITWRSLIVSAWRFRGIE